MSYLGFLACNFDGIKDSQVIITISLLQLVFFKRKMLYIFIFFWVIGQLLRVVQ